MRTANYEFCWWPQSLITILCDTFEVLSLFIIDLFTIFIQSVMFTNYVRSPTEILTLFCAWLRKLPINWILVTRFVPRLWVMTLWKIFAVDTQFKQLRKRSLKKKFRLQRDSNPWPLRYRCSALPTELWSHNCWEQVNFSGSIMPLRVIQHYSD